LEVSNVIFIAVNN